jgi:hypothetical protein
MTHAYISKSPVNLRCRCEVRNLPLPLMPTAVLHNTDASFIYHENLRWVTFNLDLIFFQFWTQKVKENVRLFSGQPFYSSKTGILTSAMEDNGDEQKNPNHFLPTMFLSTGNKSSNAFLTSSCNINCLISEERRPKIFFYYQTVLSKLIFCICGNILFVPRLILKMSITCFVL